MYSARNRQRIAALKIYGNRALYWNRTNTPFLSGDGFAGLCDVSLFAPRYRGVSPKTKDILRAQSIFCPSDKLESLLADYGSNIKARVLVLGNSDRDFLEPVSLPDSIRRVYLQNSHISNDLYRTLPIGIENLRWGKNGFKNLFENSFAQVPKKNAILVGPFSPTHPERKELHTWRDSKNTELFFCDNYLKPHELAIVASRYKFIACPRGNGTDTHRFWETLYRGSIPVVKETRWSNSIKEMGLQILELRQWNLEEFLEKKNAITYLDINPILSPILWLDYWKNQFRIES